LCFDQIKGGQNPKIPPPNKFIPGVKKGVLVSDATAAMICATLGAIAMCNTTGFHKAAHRCNTVILAL